MSTSGYPIPVTERTVRANGLDIWYVEAGAGPPLLLLHGGGVSNGPLWAASEWGWGGQLGPFAPHFRVFAPDLRGHGRTANPSGALGYPQYAEDMLAFAQALGLERPLVCGFSDGGAAAALMGILAPDVPRAVVNLAGFDMFSPDPNYPSRVQMREQLGGSPNATGTDYALMVSRSPTSRLRQRRIEDFETTQGPGALQRYFEQIFPVWTAPMAYTIADLARLAAPALFLVGDRDEFCPVELSAAAFRMLPRGEFGVLPHTTHAITAPACALMLDFLLRHRD
jgi:pimeloyl-ACP methyl ester carboxylesterase